jgi:hypothetical protein
MTSCGALDVLPQELMDIILGMLDLKSRIKMTRVSKTFYVLYTFLLERRVTRILVGHGLQYHVVRLLLAATPTVMGGYAITQALGLDIPVTRGSLEFYTPNYASHEVKAFLKSTCAYHRHGATSTEGELRVVPFSNGISHIRLIECVGDPVKGVLMYVSTHQMGYWDGRQVNHAYGELTASRRTLTTARHLVMQNDVEDHRAVWRAVQRSVLRGFSWIFELPCAHTCGVHLSCPATLRSSNDGGWLHLNLPSASYAPAVVHRHLCWSLWGSRCRGSSEEFADSQNVSEVEGVYPGMRIRADRLRRRVVGYNARLSGYEYGAGKLRGVYLKAISSILSGDNMNQLGA